MCLTRWSKPNSLLITTHTHTKRNMSLILSKNIMVRVCMCLCQHLWMRKYCTRYVTSVGILHCWLIHIRSVLSTKAKTAMIYLERFPLSKNSIQVAPRLGKKQQPWIRNNRQISAILVRSIVSQERIAAKTNLDLIASRQTWKLMFWGDKVNLKLRCIQVILSTSRLKFLLSTLFWGKYMRKLYY